MTKIEIVPFGGLGNRMRVLNSVLFLNKEFESEISMFWFKKAELYADFFEIFESAGYPFTIIRGIRYKICRFFFKQIYMFKYPRLYKTILSVFYDEILLDKDIKGMEPLKLLQKISNKKKVLIATCYDFFPYPDFNNFKLNLHLIEKINEFGINTSFVGVHIRRTDHSEIKGESTLESYINEIDKEIELNPQVRFYLATDDLHVKQELSAKYSARLKVQDVSLERTSEEGIFGAVIDIYNLSHCSKIICNPKSSFAVMASKIGIKKPIIKV